MALILTVQYSKRFPADASARLWASSAPALAGPEVFSGLARLRATAGTRVCFTTAHEVRGSVESIPALPCTTLATAGIINLLTSLSLSARFVNGQRWTLF